MDSGQGTNSRAEVGHETLPRLLDGSWSKRALSVLDETLDRDGGIASAIGSLHLYSLLFG